MYKAIKIPLISVFLFGALLSCRENKRPDNPEKVAQKQNEANLKNMPEEKDNSKLLVDIIHSQMYEVEMGKIGKEFAVNAKIKDFAKQIEQHHQTRLEKLYALADSYNYSMPHDLSDSQWDDINEIKSQNSNDFDQKWLNEIISVHNKSIDELVDGIEDLNDIRITNELNETLQEVRSHLETASRLQNSLFKK